MQFGVFEKFTSAYLFQIAQEKSCDYLLIIYIKKFRDGWAEGTHAYHAIREKLRHQLRHPWRARDLKTKDLIGHLWVYLIIDQSECLVCFLFLHWIDLFGLYILFSHFRPRDATRGNSFLQMSCYARANLRIANEKTKGKFPWGHHVVWNGKKCTSWKGLLTLFCNVSKKICTALNQSEWRNFSMYIISRGNIKENFISKHVS